MSSAIALLNVRTAVTPVVRTSVPFMGPTRKERKAASLTPETMQKMGGVVAPTSGIAGVKSWYDSGVRLDGSVPEPAMAVSPPPAATKTEYESKLPPVAGTSKAWVAEAGRRASWNPQRLDVSMLPASLQAQFVPEYLKAAPSYLDGSLPGDIGFDPWALATLAKPTAATDKFARTAKERDAKMLAMSPEEQKQSLAWMRESEIKHGRLAMLAAAGWPLAELASGDYLKSIGTGGRAPSLFNGHLMDFLPFLVLVFAPIAYLEFQNKDTLPEGDYGFDPLGLAGEQRPYGAFPFDAFLSKV